MKLQQPIFHPRLQIDADRAQVPDDLSGRFLKGKIQAPLAATARRIDEVRGHTGLAGTGRARHEDAASSEKALAAHHAVEPLDTSGNAFERRVMIQAE